MGTTIVGLNGEAGSGKTEAAKHLVSEHGFVLVKFAGPLKAMLRGFYTEVGLDPEVIEEKIEGSLKEEPCELLGGKTPRYAMETLGTEWGRDLVSPDLWTKAWNYRVLLENRPIVVDDVRFDNEADLITGFGGLVLKLKPKVIRRKKSTHAAERGISRHKVLASIRNDGTIQELKNKLSTFLSGFSFVVNGCTEVTTTDE